MTPRSLKSRAKDLLALASDPSAAAQFKLIATHAANTLTWFEPVFETNRKLSRFEAATIRENASAVGFAATG